MWHAVKNYIFYKQSKVVLRGHQGDVTDAQKEGITE